MQCRLVPSTPAKAGPWWRRCTRGLGGWRWCSRRHWRRRGWGRKTERASYANPTHTTVGAVKTNGTDRVNRNIRSWLKAAIIAYAILWRGATKSVEQVFAGMLACGAMLCHAVPLLFMASCSATLVWTIPSCMLDDTRQGSHPGKRECSQR